MTEHRMPTQADAERRARATWTGPDGSSITGTLNPLHFATSKTIAVLDVPVGSAGVVRACCPLNEGEWTVEPPVDDPATDRVGTVRYDAEARKVSLCTGRGEDRDGAPFAYWVIAGADHLYDGSAYTARVPEGRISNRGCTVTGEVIVRVDADGVPHRVDLPPARRVITEAELQAATASVWGAGPTTRRTRDFLYAIGIDVVSV